MRLARNILVIGFAVVFIGVSMAMFMTVAGHSATIEQLRSDNAALKARLAQQDEQLKVERSKVDVLTHGPIDGIAADGKTTVTPVAQQIAYKKTYKKTYKKRYRKVRKRRRIHYRHRTRRRHRIRVSRGGARVNVEPIVRQVGATYWPQDAQLDALMWICKHESTRPGAISPGGHQGLFQLGNPPGWMVLGDAASETRAGCEYIKRRYGSPLRAKAFWQSHGWY